MSQKETDAAVAQLLRQYAQYKTLLAELDVAIAAYTKAKLTGGDASDLASRRDILKQRLSDLSDAMTFATPLVWVRYKFEAYQNDSQPIRTLRDFRLHCSKPGYICTKRFQFLNGYLTQRNMPSLLDQSEFPDELLLSGLFPLVERLSADQELLDRWQEHEYYHIDGRVAKWELG